MSLHYNGDNSCFGTGKEIFKFKAYNKNVNFPTQFCPGNLWKKNRKKKKNISEKSDAVKSWEASFRRNAYDFSVDYNAIDKSAAIDKSVLLNIHRYFMVKNYV